MNELEINSAYENAHNDYIKAKQEVIDNLLYAKKHINEIPNYSVLNLINHVLEFLEMKEI